VCICPACGLSHVNADAVLVSAELDIHVCRLRPPPSVSLASELPADEWTLIARALYAKEGGLMAFVRQVARLSRYHRMQKEKAAEYQLMKAYAPANVPTASWLHYRPPASPNKLKVVRSGDGVPKHVLHVLPKSQWY
jgi:hypothetical protein